MCIRFMIEYTACACKLETYTEKIYYNFSTERYFTIDFE